MADSPIEREFIQILRGLSDAQQQSLLRYAQSMQDPLINTPTGAALLESVRAIQWPAEDLAEMRAAIEADCGRIDWDEWQ